MSFWILNKIYITYISLAGDYVKFNFPMAASTTLLAWGAIDFQKGYSRAGQEQATLNTIKWATDYFIKCHVAPNVLYAQVNYQWTWIIIYNNKKKD